MGLGCVKTKSDLVVMPSGGRIFAFFCSERDPVFTQPGSQAEIPTTRPAGPDFIQLRTFPPRAASASVPGGHLGLRPLAWRWH